MTLIKIEQMDNGSHHCCSSDNITKVPRGWAVIPGDMETPNLPYGDITVEEIDGVTTVTSWKARELPEPIPEPTSEHTVQDDTDTMLAIKEAARRGFTKITIIGGLSGRLDHTFANIQTLAYGVQNDLDILITDGENTAFIMRPGKITLEKKEGFSLSVFSYGNTVSNLCIDGVKYPVSNATLTSFFPLGVSNDITKDHANISFSEGMLLIIISKLN